MCARCNAAIIVLHKCLFTIAEGIIVHDYILDLGSGCGSFSSSHAPSDTLNITAKNHFKFNFMRIGFI
jgi:hypothetical protein